MVTDRFLYIVPSFLIVKKSIWFIINPIAGIRRKDDIPSLVLKHLDHDQFDFEIQYTKYKGHAKE